MKRSFPFLFGVAGVLVALDQWTKHWASLNLVWREPVHVVGDLVRLTYARNSGIAFSLLAGHGLPLYVFSIIAAVAVVALFARHSHLSLARQLSLALILGGAIGNLIDRVRTGQVVDFILLSWGRHEFPVFNVADMAVTCGVVLFALVWTREPAAAPDGAATAPGDGATATAPALTPPAAADQAPFAAPEAGSDEQGAGPDRARDRGGRAGGPLAREGTDRPVA